MPAKRPALSREGSDVRKPIPREGSSDSLLGDKKQPTAHKLGHKPNLDVRSSGYGIRREKSGELRPPSVRREKSGDLRTPSVRREKSSEIKPPSGAAKRGGISNLRPPTASAKVDTGLRRSGGRAKQHESEAGKVRRTSSQTSLGSVDDEGAKESPRRGSGVTSPTSKLPSRTGSKSPTKKSVSSSRESLTETGATTKGASPGASKIPSLRASKPPASKGTPGYMRSTTSTKAHKTAAKEKSDTHKGNK